MRMEEAMETSGEFDSSAQTLSSLDEDSEYICEEYLEEEIPTTLKSTKCFAKKSGEIKPKKENIDETKQIFNVKLKDGKISGAKSILTRVPDTDGAEVKKCLATKTINQVKIKNVKSVIDDKSIAPEAKVLGSPASPTKSISNQPQKFALKVKARIPPKFIKKADPLITPEVQSQSQPNSKQKLAKRSSYAEKISRLRSSSEGISARYILPRTLSTMSPPSKLSSPTSNQLLTKTVTKTPSPSTQQLKAASKADLINNLLSSSNTKTKTKENVEPIDTNSILIEEDSSEIPNLNNIEIIDVSSEEEDTLPVRKNIIPITAKTKPTEKNATKQYAIRTVREEKLKAPSHVLQNITDNIKEKPKVLVSPPTSSDDLVPVPADKASIIPTKSPAPQETPVSPDKSLGSKSILPAQPIAFLPQNTVITAPGGLPNFNFVIPRADVLRCKQYNTPLFLAMPPKEPVTTGNVKTPNSNLLMILPHQLPAQVPDQPSINFLVSAATKPGITVQSLPGNTSQSLPTNTSQTLPSNTSHILTSKAHSFVTQSINSAVTRQISTYKAKETRKPPPPIEEDPLQCKILNTKEKDGPSYLCWYASKTGKRDLDGFLYKDRLGFSKSEVMQAKRCLRKINIHIYDYDKRLDGIASKIITLKRGYKKADHAPGLEKRSEPHRRIGKKAKDKIIHDPDIPEGIDINKIKLVDLSLLKKNPVEMDPLSTPPPLADDKGAQSDSDNDASDLYYTKKVVILKNDPSMKIRKLRPMPKIRLRSGKRGKQPKSPKLLKIQDDAPIKPCTVMLERNKNVEEAFKKQEDVSSVKQKDTSLNTSVRASRKRKVDLESMGLIKKVRRRNAIDSPARIPENRSQPIKKPDESKPENTSNNLDANQSDEESYIIDKNKIAVDKKKSDHSIEVLPKSPATEHKKGVIMSYRDYQKITKLSQTEIRFIFILNTIQSLEDLKIDETKPLMILDRFNYTVDFAILDNYNVLFARDDGELIPSQLLKNFEFVFFVKRGLIKVVSRPVLCKYILERNDNNSNTYCVSSPESSKSVKDTKSVKQRSEDEKEKKEKSEVQKPPPTVKNKESTKEEDKDKFIRTLKLKRSKTFTEPATTSKTSIIKVRKDLIEPKPSTSSGKTGKQLKNTTHVSDKVQKETATYQKHSRRSSKEKLDMKFIEVEKTLSMMFEKPEASSPDPPVKHVSEISKKTNKKRKEKVVTDLAAELADVLEADDSKNLDSTTKITEVEAVSAAKDADSNKSVERSSKSVEKSSKSVEKSNKSVTSKQAEKAEKNAPKKVDQSIISSKSNENEDSDKLMDVLSAPLEVASTESEQIGPLPVDEIIVKNIDNAQPEKENELNDKDLNNQEVEIINVETNLSQDDSELIKTDKPKEESSVNDILEEAMRESDISEKLESHTSETAATEKSITDINVRLTEIIENSCELQTEVVSEKEIMLTETVTEEPAQETSGTKEASLDVDQFLAKSPERSNGDEDSSVGQFLAKDADTDVQETADTDVQETADTDVQETADTDVQETVDTDFKEIASHLSSELTADANVEDSADTNSVSVSESSSLKRKLRESEDEEKNDEEEPQLKKLREDLSVTEQENIVKNYSEFEPVGTDMLNDTVSENINSEFDVFNESSNKMDESVDINQSDVIIETCETLKSSVVTGNLSDESCEMESLLLKDNTTSENLADEVDEIKQAKGVEDLINTADKAEDLTEKDNVSENLLNPEFNELSTKNTTPDDLLSEEIDTDLSIHTNEISKNLPDDYLEK